MPDYELLMYQIIAGLTTAKEVNMHCQRRAMTRLGQGYFSDVYAATPDAALKVCVTPDNWPKYIMWANENGHCGKEAPFVYSIRFYPDGYVAIMERLDCTLMAMRSTNEFMYRFYRQKISPFVDKVRAQFLNDIDHNHPDNNIMLKGDRVVLTDPLYNHSHYNTHSWRPYKRNKLPALFVDSISDLGERWSSWVDTDAADGHRW